MDTTGSHNPKQENNNTSITEEQTIQIAENTKTAKPKQRNDEALMGTPRSSRKKKKDEMNMHIAVGKAV